MDKERKNGNEQDERKTRVLENGTKVTRVPFSEVVRLGSFVRPDFREVNRRNSERNNDE